MFLSETGWNFPNQLTELLAEIAVEEIAAEELAEIAVERLAEIEELAEIAAEEPAEIAVVLQSYSAEVLHYFLTEFVEVGSKYCPITDWALLVEGEVEKIVVGSSEKLEGRGLW